MIRRPTEDDINERKDIWKAIRWRMNERRITPQELARRARYSQDLIERGISGEPVPIRHALRSFVEAFGLREGRFYEETADSLTDDVCKKLLKPPSAMPPRQGNFWDYDY
jgi:hypothetical protein